MNKIIITFILIFSVAGYSLAQQIMLNQDGINRIKDRIIKDYKDINTFTAQVNDKTKFIGAVQQRITETNSEAQTLKNNINELHGEIQDSEMALYQVNLYVEQFYNAIINTTFDAMTNEEVNTVTNTEEYLLINDVDNSIINQIG